MAQHLLDGPQIGSSFQQVRRERVAQQMRVDPERIEPRLLSKFPQDQEGACPGQRAAACIQEELGTVPGIEKRAPASEIAAQRFGCVPADRNNALLAALSDDADEPVVEVDPRPHEPDRLGDSETCAIEQFDEGLITERARLCAGGSLNQALCFTG
jgi:hypothetical protein